MQHGHHYWFCGVSRDQEVPAVKTNSCRTYVASEPWKARLLVRCTGCILACVYVCLLTSMPIMYILAGWDCNKGSSSN
ncbi:hypothetical protein BJX99DRAFT_233217 [Aspergillus californicus]